MCLKNIQKLHVNCYLISLIASVAIIGDYLVASSRRQLSKAICDNSTHAIIGGLSWFIVSLNHKNAFTSQTLIEVGLCTLASSLIDLDHFVAARSTKIKDATSLKTRPFLHCSTIPLVITSFLLYVAFMFNWNQLKRVTLIIFTAFATHHTRDAARRGYWFYPFGSTPPIPYYMYITLTVLIPYFGSFLLDVSKIDKNYNKYIDV